MLKSRVKRALLLNDFSYRKPSPQSRYADLYLIPDIRAGYEDNKTLHTGNSIAALPLALDFDGLDIANVNRRGWSSTLSLSVHVFNSFLWIDIGGNALKYCRKHRI